MRTAYLLLALACLILGTGLEAVAQPSRRNYSMPELRQQVRQGHADTTRVKWLLQLSAFYLNKAEQTQQVLDSALVFAAQAAELGRQLHFMPGVDAALFQTGQVYAKRGGTRQAQALMKSLSDTSRIKLILELGNNQLRPSKAQPAGRDSALYFFQQAQRLSDAAGRRHWQDESAFQLGDFYIQGQDMPRGKEFFMQVIKAARQAHDKLAESRAWYRLADSFATLGRVNYTAERLEYLSRALMLARQINNQPQEELSLFKIAEVHVVQGKAAEAEQEMLAIVALKKARGHKDTYYALEALHGIEYNKGNRAKALNYMLQTLRSVQEDGHEELLDYVYALLGALYIELNDVDTGVAYLKKSLAISERNGQLAAHMSIISKLTEGLIKQGKMQEALTFLRDISQKKMEFTPKMKKVIAQAKAQCFVALKQYPQAEKCLLESVALDSQVGSYGGMAAWRALSQLYITTKQYAKARPYLEQLLAIPGGVLPVNVIADAHLASFKVDSAAGDYLAAIAHYSRSRALSDSIFTATKSRQVEEVKVQYETTQKEQRIQLLTEKEQRQQSQLDHERIVRNGIIAGAGLLVLLLGVSYNRYRLKQRSNQLLEAQQLEINQKNHALEQVVSEKDQLLEDKDQLLEDKEWMLKEIHHRVKNNLQIITSLLDSQATYLKDKAALSAIRESQNRVHSMALIHQKLYQGTNLASVPMPAYVHEIVSYLIASFDSQRFVRAELAVADVALDVSLAVPVGLILNEAITNSLKYAFPAQQPGILGVELTHTGKTYTLTLRDNGAGLPPGFNPERSRTLGLSLIRGLSKQIEGRLQIDGRAGMHITLEFDDIEAVTRLNQRADVLLATSQ